MHKQTSTRPPKHKFTWTRFGNQLRNIVTNPFNLITLLCFIILICLVVTPLLSLIENSFVVDASDARRVKAEAGSFSTYYWQYLLSSKMS